MAVALAAVAYAHSLNHNQSGRHLHGGSQVAMNLLTASDSVAPADRSAHYSGESGAAAGSEQADIGSSSSAPEIVVASTVAAAA